MSEIKTEIKQNPDGNYTITDAHSTADVVRWLLTQDSKETILYLLGDTPQRQWVGLTKEDMPSGEDPMFDHLYFIAGMVYADKVLKKKNT